jgi:hypothetical protein
MKRVLTVLLVGILAVMLIACESEQEPFGSNVAEDSQVDPNVQKAYNYMLVLLEGMDDPSSIRIFGGSFYIDSAGEEILCVIVSADNSLGTRVTGYYTIATNGTVNKADEYLVELFRSEEYEPTTDIGRMYRAFLVEDAFDYREVNSMLVKKYTNRFNIVGTWDFEIRYIKDSGNYKAGDFMSRGHITFTEKEVAVNDYFWGGLKYDLNIPENESIGELRIHQTTVADEDGTYQLTVIDNNTFEIIDHNTRKVFIRQ